MNLYELHIEHLDNTLTKISTKINQRQLYFTFDSIYNEYVTKTYDSFLIGILLFAMFNKKSIHVDGPVSERLYNNITKNIIPMIHYCYPQFHLIGITAKELVAQHHNSSETGFGLSCGIDSLCCIEDIYYKENNEQLKAGFACNFHSGGSDNVEQYTYRLNHIRNFINTNTTLKLLSIESNLNEFIIPGFTHDKIHGIKTISFVYLFQKLFKRFYISSGMTLREFKLVKNPASYGWMEGYLTPLLSTESTEICLHGTNYTRLYKTYLISKNSTYDNYIDVCINTNSKNMFINCGNCFKCLRTLLTLECYTDIRRYSKIFNLKNYIQHRNSYIKHLQPKIHVLDKQLLELLYSSKKLIKA